MFLFRPDDLLRGGFTDRLGQPLPGQTVPGCQQSILQGLSARVLHPGLAGLVIICKHRGGEGGGVRPSILLWQSWDLTEPAPCLASGWEDRTD